MSSGKAILKCPSCEKSLVNIGSYVERIHPVPRFIERHYWLVVIGWGASTPVLFILLGLIGIGSGNCGAHGWLGLMLMPVFAMYFLKRMYPIYRITDCPYCGHHEKLKLGHSGDA